MTLDAKHTAQSSAYNAQPCHTRDPFGMAACLIATLHGYDRCADETMAGLSFQSTYAWIAAQAFALTLPGFLIGQVLAKWYPRTAWLTGMLLILAVPIVCLLDIVTHTLVGERFLSAATSRIIVSLLPTVVVYATWRTMLSVVVCGCLIIGLTLLAIRISSLSSQRWLHLPQSMKPSSAMLVFCFIAVLLSTPAIRQFDRTVASMRDHATRHPFCAFRIVASRGIGIREPVGEDRTLARLRGLLLLPNANRVRSNLLSVRAMPPEENTTSNKEHRDIVIVIAESLRHEMVRQATMPHLFEFTHESLWCQKHFSAANSTNFGVFGLMNGIEATWFERLSRNCPVLNSVFRSAGYELGFFTGSHDWQAFDMDSFIREEHFDVFHESEGDWLTADIAAADAAVRFIDRRAEFPDSGSSNPRLAVLYLYVTHLPFFSLPEDEVFHPAAVEDFAIPFTRNERDRVWNRYQNSARTLDRLIAPLLRADKIVVVLGDHGEAFLEDDCICHGSRISSVQTMTPAVIHVPQQSPRVVDVPTMHFDILPTLLAATGVTTTGTEWLEGVDLFSESIESLRSRSFVVRNFVTSDCGIIGPWSLQTHQPFAHRCIVSLEPCIAAALNSVDHRGLELDDTPSAQPVEAFRQWRQRRFGVGAVDDQASIMELFTRVMTSDLTEVRLQAVEIAKEVESPSPSLLRLVRSLTLDDVPEIRASASEAVVLLHRRRIWQGSPP